MTSHSSVIITFFTVTTVEFWQLYNVDWLSSSFYHIMLLKDLVCMTGFNLIQGKAWSLLTSPSFHGLNFSSWHNSFYESVGWFCQKSMSHQFITGSPLKILSWQTFKSDVLFSFSCQNSNSLEFDGLTTALIHIVFTVLQFAALGSSHLWWKHPHQLMIDSVCVDKPQNTM